jgi:bifunctional DNA-binding transcriptional regulator/antitoxin component of YhaV-PrlF toxin-antitoxin module
MHATLTSKAPLTLPKSSRETLGLKAGQRFLVRISKNGELLLTPQRVDPLSICGVLPKRRTGAVSVEAMDRGVGEHLARKHRRLPAKRPSVRR